jgi:hypothetical protein
MAVAGDTSDRRQGIAAEVIREYRELEAGTRSPSFETWDRSRVSICVALANVFPCSETG